MKKGILQQFPYKSTRRPFENPGKTYKMGCPEKNQEIPGHIKSTKIQLRGYK